MAAPAYADTVGTTDNPSTYKSLLVQLPAGSTIELTGPTEAVYSLYDIGGISVTRVLNGESAYQVDQVALNLETGGISYRVSTDEFIRPGAGVKLNAGSTDTSTLTFNFIDQAGTSIAPQKVFTISSSPDSKDITKTLDNVGKQNLPITGYTLNSKNPVTASDDNTTFTYNYIADTTSGSGNTSNNNSNSTNIIPTTPAVTPPSTEPDTTTGTPLAVKGTAIYATKKIGLYRTTNFTKANRKIWYVKKSRQNRPKFIVTGYKRSQNGTLRYRIRDINHNSLTNDRRGYITANSQYVQPLYYQSQPTKIKVIAAKGLNGYHHVDLSGRIARHYKRGSVLKVTAIRDYHLTTRLMLANGQYVSGNKTLVIKK
ncbi:DUF5776 domain-containing protein [Levilactobacillus wangkuiensis]|uniref:DUF5776 domain-containing protein n=1 Tax=Levilactobacillus wangkuiensis TaxID=2799566 RepID=UPI001940B0B9|nr:DUF5776 domain-containing protein [Levilactobacillus wangkuiensis]